MGIVNLKQQFLQQVAQETVFVSKRVAWLHFISLLLMTVSCGIHLVSCPILFIAWTVLGAIAFAAIGIVSLPLKAKKAQAVLWCFYHMVCLFMVVLLIVDACLADNLLTTMVFGVIGVYCTVLLIFGVVKMLGIKKMISLNDLYYKEKLENDWLQYRLIYTTLKANLAYICTICVLMVLVLFRILFYDGNAIMMPMAFYFPAAFYSMYTVPFVWYKYCSLT